MGPNYRKRIIASGRFSNKTLLKAYLTRLCAKAIIAEKELKLEKINMFKTNCIGLLSMMTRKLKRTSASMLPDGVEADVLFEGQQYRVTIKPLRNK